MNEYAATQLGRIAYALERIADYLGDRATTPAEMAQMEPAFKPTGVVCTATPSVMTSDYAAAVQAIKDMPDDLPPAAPAGPKVSKADVIAALNRFAAVHGVAAGKKVLAQYGGKLDEVDPEFYGELVALLEVTK